MPIKDKEERKIYAREWVKKRRVEFFSDKKCSWCGSIEKLELHHLDPNKKIANAIWSWKKEKRSVEIAKCIILCKKCHHVYHAWLLRRWVHGLSNTYKKGCRCDECRHAQYRGQKEKKKWYIPKPLPPQPVPN